MQALRSDALFVAAAAAAAPSGTDIMIKQGHAWGPKCGYAAAGTGWFEMLGVVVRVEDSVGVRVHRWGGLRGALGWCVVLVVDGDGCCGDGGAAATVLLLLLLLLLLV